MSKPNKDILFSPLLADIMTKMSSDTAAVTTSLIDSLTEQLADSHAELDAVRATVGELLDGDYMPTPAGLRRALWPTPEMRSLYRRDRDPS